MPVDVVRLSVGARRASLLVSTRRLARVFLAGLLLSSVLPTAAAALTREKFTLGPHVYEPDQLTLGPDGNLWMTDVSSNSTVGMGYSAIARMRPNGEVKRYAASGYDITTGSDGNLWYTRPKENKIGRLTPTGVVTEFSGLAASSCAQSQENSSWPSEITAGPDGNLWFSETRGCRIGRITPNGSLTEFDVGDNTFPEALTAGPDGNVWFLTRNAVGRITPAGQVVYFYIGYGNSSIAAGPDGNLWVTGFKGTFAMTPYGVVVRFIAKVNGSSITSGPDGKLWVSGDWAGAPTNLQPRHDLWRVSTGGQVVQYFVGRAQSQFEQHEGANTIILGPQGKLWMSGPRNIWRLS